jgi:hypothetical protein
VQFHFSTVVWGDWHTGLFLDVNLPSLLASGNLPAFTLRHDVKYRILTTAKDARRIEASPSYRRACEIAELALVRCDVREVENPFHMHHLLWRRSIEEAKAARAMILFVPPDVIWADGSYAHVAEIAPQGKKAIFMTYLRVVSESCVPAVIAAHRRPNDPIIQASPREFVDMAFRHMHPLTWTYLRDSPRFPVHPEFILWSVPGEGLLMRIFARELFAFDPNYFELNAQSLIARVDDPEAIHFITDSDDLFALSLAPLMKDVEWYRDRVPLDVHRIADWWLTYDSPVNDLISAKPFRFHSTDASPAKWRRAEIESDALLRRIRAEREIERLLRLLPLLGARLAAQILALARWETKITRLRVLAGPLSILAPLDADAMDWLLSGGDELLKSQDRGRLVDLILDHVIEGDLALEDRQERTIRTAGGGTRRLSWAGGKPSVDGIPLASEGRRIGTSWVYTIEKLLKPSLAMEVAHPVRKVAS